MQTTVLSAEARERALRLRDLTDPSQGPHAVQLLVDAVAGALRSHWGCQVRLCRAHPVVSVADNYDRLGYPPEAVTRDARYTRYVAPGLVLRTHTSALVPGLLRSLAGSPPRDVLLACPGLTYRRDSIDRLHTGEPHQVDLWRLAEARLTTADLDEMVATAVAATLPGATPRTTPTQHPYTLQGLQVDVRDGEDWVEVGECGLASPRLLAESGLDVSRWSGLAMGLGLDRLLMLRKGIPDIRLLRAETPRVAGQMLDLAPYRPVSSRPPVRRDLSLAVPEEDTADDLGDRVREALGGDAASVEEVAVLSETPGASLPPAAVDRLGLLPGQKNVLVRVVLRHPERTLTHPEANELRDRVYAALHRGTARQWAVSQAPSTRA